MDLAPFPAEIKLH